MIHQTIAHYSITEKLGEGGMGEVYRARDTKLNRDVALKILPQVFAQDSQRMARFEREAQVLASLNHTNIAQIHGLEETDGTKALVLELVEGETLQEQIARGPIPVDEALKIALQICEGLEAAHEKGIIHRDLKPANIKITPEGQVKILDFGLAKALEGETPASDLSHSPTLTHQSTQAGVILGTASYMSPEQARGKPVDKRTDIWAFGCVLYEILTGKKVFGGESRDETVSDVLAAVLRGEPDWESLPKELSWSTHALVRQCLQKEAAYRLRDIGDFRIGLSVPSPYLGVLGNEKQGWPRRFWLLLGGAVLIGLIGWGGFLLESGTPSDSAEVYRLSFDLPESQQIATDFSKRLFDLSDDGNTIVWVGVEEPRRIYYRRLSEREVRTVPGTEGATRFGFSLSPDSQDVAFVKDNSLWRAPLEGGGTPHKLFQGQAILPIWDSAWSSDGSIAIVFAYSGLSLLKTTEMKLVALTELDREAGERIHTNPRFLPQGRGILFANCKGAFICDLEVLDLQTSEPRRVPLLKDVLYAEYIPTGHLVYAEGPSVLAVPFDLERLELTGSATTVLADVQLCSRGIFTQFAVSQNGTLVHIPEQGLHDWKLALLDSSGSPEFMDLPNGYYMLPRFSPDGSEALVNFRRKGAYMQQVALVDLHRSTLRQLTEQGHWDSTVVWNPDGLAFAFSSDRDGPWNIFRQPIEGSGRAEKVIGSDRDQWVHDWSSIGSHLLLMENTPSGGFRVGVLNLGDNDANVLWITPPENSEGEARFSPDGKWIAYISSEEGSSEVFLRELHVDEPAAGRKERVSRNGGWFPTWSPEGDRLFYLNRDGSELLSAAVETGPSLRIGEERVVYAFDSIQAVKPEWLGMGGHIDISPDGQRFLLVAREKMDRPMQVNVCINWFEELKRLVPTE